MIAPFDHGASRNLLALLRTLFDIVLLRKGPEHLPRSGILLAMAVALWIFSALLGVVAIEEFTEADFILGLFSGLVGLICYAAVVVFAGHSARALQMVTAIIGVSALITLAWAIEYAVLEPLLGEATAGLIAYLIVCWSVLVEGHIVARAIDRHWYVGIVLAVAVFSLQLVLNRYITSGG